MAKGCSTSPTRLLAAFPTPQLILSRSLARLCAVWGTTLVPPQARPGTSLSGMPSRAPKGFPKLDYPLPHKLSSVTSVVLRGEQGSLIGDWGRGGIRGLPKVGSHTCPSWSSGTLQSDGCVNECIEQGLSCCGPVGSGMHRRVSTYPQSWCVHDV